MFQKFALAIVLACMATSATFAQSSIPQVRIKARLERQSDSQATLIIQANIADGLHIYAQSQPKPFLATKFSVDDSEYVKSVGEFLPSKSPLMLRNEKLGVDLHEHEGEVIWKSTLELADDAPGKFNISGKVFAQACQSDRCYAPKNYSFNTDDGSVAGPMRASSLMAEKKLPPKSFGAAASATAGEFSIDNLQIVTETDRSGWSVLPLAFVAGLLLNFMPCVLPVVGLKLLSFVQQAESDRREIFFVNVAYTAGLLTVMLVLATLATFAGLGWGEQFSSTAFTVTLAAMVFAFGLSFLGVWEIPLPGFVGEAGGRANREGYVGAFSKGVLSTLLATPCSGPFLGAALAWAIVQPTYLTYSVFASVGFGMASPFLLVGLFPSTVRFLPRPGNWMIVFKQIMGFVMLATVVYLLSFMANSSVVPTIFLLLGIGFALWIAGQTPVYAERVQLVKTWSLAAAVIFCASIVSFGWLRPVMQSRFERSAERWVSSLNQDVSFAASAQNQDAITWEPYSPSRLEETIRNGHPVFIDFTADWCLTCKSNEAAAINQPEFAEALRQGNVVALRADKTDANAQVDVLLQKLGNTAASIPFYAFFSADRPYEPELLDGLFTSSVPFVAAAKRSARTRTAVSEPVNHR